MLKQTLTVTSASALAASALAAAGTAASAAPTTSHSAAATGVVPTAVHASAQARPARQIAYRAWSTPKALRRGAEAGVLVTRHGVRMGTPARRRGGHDLGRWTSPLVRPGFNLTEAIASWKATTPRGTHIGIQVRGRTPNGRLSSWDSLGHWASHERNFRRQTHGSQEDDVARVAADTLQTRGRATFSRWQVRVTLYRRAGSAATPVLHSVGVMTSRLPSGDPRTSATTMQRQRDLRVPRRSQMIHSGHYSQWGGGGQAWCSPTSTTMLLSFWGRGPRPRAYRWVADGHTNPEVDHAARSVYDYGYNGAGNWAFNTAYAGRFGTDSFVTRLRSLREAERFIRKGIPLVASVSFGSGELTGAPIGATAGHLLVIRGFTAAGDVIVNDPAEGSNRTVRNVYDRGQFTDAWLGGSGGLVYVIRPEGKQLPKRPAQANW